MMDGLLLTMPAGAGLWFGLAAGSSWLLWLLLKLWRSTPVDEDFRRVWFRGEGSEAGTATIEFALVFPILLVFILLLVQVTLLMVGNLYVHYAAFAATRAAIVQIPRNTTDEPTNVIWPRNPGMEKYRAIRRAAIFALVPVSGRSSGDADSVGDVSPPAYVDALREHFAQGQGEQPAWVDSLIEEKVRYAATNTTIELLVYDEDAQPPDFKPLSYFYTFGPRDPVTVRVGHRFDLAVPYVRFFFADGRYQSDDGQGAYTIIEAQTTLTNQGVDPAMPEPPSIRRLP